MLSVIIAISVFLGYFVESIFGFGGTIISLAMVGLVLDIKDAILIVTYASICCSAFILLSDLQSFSFRHFFRICIFAFPGVILGTYLFTIMTSDFLLKFFSLFLIFYSVYSFFKKTVVLPPIIAKPMIFLGGVLQGIYATGGPFVLLGYGQEFKNKSSLRAVMAAFFVFFNVLRLGQIYLMDQLDVAIIYNYWWLVFPVALAVCGGFIIHLKISDKLFQKGILFLMLIASLFYLFK